MRNRRKAVAVALIVAVGLTAAVLLAASQGLFQSVMERAGRTQTVGSVEDAEWSQIIEYQGDLWERNQRLTTVLFLGVDSDARVEAAGVTGLGGSADTILLFVLDRDSETTRIIRVDGDMLAQVDVFDAHREKVAAEELPIRTQYAFGENASRSCFLVKRTLSKLLHGLTIDGCCALTIDGMSGIADAIGGLSVTMPEDWSAIDPHYTKGADVTLDGAAVERFVRYQDSEDGAQGGKNRQAWLLKELFRQMAARGGDDFSALYDAVSDELETDLDVLTIRNIARFRFESGTISIPTRSEGDAELYPDEEGLRSLLIETYYKKRD